MSVAGPSTKPVQAYYCSVCSLPTEYCEFGPSVSKCKTTLEEADKAEFERIWGAGALAARIGTLSVEKNEKLEADAAKAEQKAARKAAAEAKLKESTKIIIKREERTKRKVLTHIQGLELFGVDLKKAAKLFASKFATGSSVSKNPQGQDEIVVQGDVGDEVVEMLKQQVGVLKGAPGDQVSRVEAKKKKEPEAEA
ncbi:Translation machinery-associated protein 22 [Vanrija albida]|uniref:Translation machinery-associated protein 22 n=1 Tax=Vanrija albida TaxID=181172 RepID=A0ABR3PS20_9TREE